MKPKIPPMEMEKLRPQDIGAPLRKELRSHRVTITFDAVFYNRLQLMMKYINGNFFNDRLEKWLKNLIETHPDILRIEEGIRLLDSCKEDN